MRARKIVDTPIGYGLLTDDWAYLLGVFWGDGNIYHYKNKIVTQWKFQFRVVSEKFMASVKSTVERLGFNATTGTYLQKGHPNRKPVFYLTVESKSLYEWLKGSRNLGSLMAVFESQRVFLGFLRGFYESEGSILENNGSRAIEIPNINIDLLTLIHSTLIRMGYHPTLRVCKRQYRLNDHICYKIGLYRKAEVYGLIEAMNPVFKREVIG